MTAPELPEREPAVDRITGKRYHRPPPKHELPPEKVERETILMPLAEVGRLWRIETFLRWLISDIGSCSGSLPGAADCGTCTYCRARTALGERE